MRIGLLLGSFDPIHIAHVNLAACTLNSGLCDKVLFVVAQHNPWKEHKPADFDLRCKMVYASIIGLDNCEICRVEEGIEPPTYSYKTINKLLEIYPKDELFLICGSDTIEKIPQWKCFNTEIKDKIGFIVVNRNDNTEIEDEKKAFIIHQGNMSSLTNKEFWYIKPKKINVSSTMVRNMIQRNMNPYPYITAEVLKIINKNKLYR